MALGDNIHQRLMNLGIAIGLLCKTLPPNAEATHIRHQLFRCATSCAPNFAEARAAESRKDFVHKLGVVLKELEEIVCWLEYLRGIENIPDSTIDPLIKETNELCRIIFTSIRTAKGNLGASMM